MKNAILAIVVALTLLPSQLLAGTNKSTAQREQTSFCGDDAPDELVLKPTPLPVAVLNALMNTTEAKQARELAKNERTKLAPSALFKGTKVRLSDSGDQFFLVLGLSPMSGADNDWFWLVRQSGKKATILLFAGANCLDITQTHTMGYRDIVTNWSSASQSLRETFKYNGRSYKLRRRKWRPI